MLDLPPFTPVRQVQVQPVVADIAKEVREQWSRSSLPRRVRPGQRVAVAVGSRGIANVALMVRTTLDVLRDLKVEPFVVAAMGSHGGGTAEGQRELLAEYGISQAALGVPVKTDMATVQLGCNSWGEPVFWDKNAFEADAVVTISRVKAHTDFRGRYESGIVKMLGIGLGKRDGAAQHHRWGLRGLAEMLPESVKVIVEKTKFVAGLAILENAKEQTAVIRAIDRENLFDEEPALLEQAKAIMGRLPFAELDLLVIGEIGKNYSGAGIDPNVVGRLLIEGEPETFNPKITRICALDLSPESHGNGTGVGIADLTTDRLLAQIDPVPFRMNNLTACFLLRSKLPIGCSTDQECIEAGIATCWQPDRTKVRMAIIPNTLEVADLWISPSLVPLAKANRDLAIHGEAQAIPFDNAGNLQQRKLFPHSVQARRR
ncbi:MAG TPA: lactate racemase domain-containing protein [Gemmataceae bacterium]|nr:lactate racemase domain-containing protein [Gemmataceae bacterium]